MSGSHDAAFRDFDQAVFGICHVILVVSLQGYIGIGKGAEVYYNDAWIRRYQLQ